MKLLPDQPTQVYVILNPVAGNYDDPSVQRSLKQYLSNTCWTYTVYKTTGQEHLAELVRQKIDQGYKLFVAFGGDGTVSAVADGLAQTDIPLAIIPLGTGNALARELQIPQNLEAALHLMVGQHSITEIDLIHVDRQYCVLDIGVGFSSFIMRATSRLNKRRFGRLAYIVAGVKEFIGFQPELFELMVDGQRHRERAAQVTVANARVMGATPFRWGPHIRPDDGQFDLCIIRTRTLFDYLRLTWNLVLGRERHDPNIHYLLVKEEAIIEAGRPLPVQGDGEIIGQTPVQVHIAPGALRVIVPQSGPKENL